MRTAKAPSVAVAIVSFNTRDLLVRCLASLEVDAVAGLAQVWVVDNGSDDGSADVARACGFASVIERADNPGFGPAVNLVAEATDTKWLACANADVALTPGSLARLLGAGDSDPRAGAVAPRLELPDGTTQVSVHAFPTLATMAAYNTGLARVLPGVGARLALPDHWDAGRPRTVDWAVGAFLLVRRTAWDEVGGFGPSRTLYTEDLDLGWRLRAAGWSTRYEPAVVMHDESAATRRAWGGGRHDRSAAATYVWLRRRQGTGRAITIGAVNVAGASGRALAGAVRRPREPAWKVAALDARRHARGLVAALRADV